MNILTIVIGVLTILGFVLQIRDIFPTHRETRKSITLIVFGVFLGAILGSLHNLKLDITTPQNPVLILAIAILGLFSIVLAVTVVLAITTDNDGKRKELSQFSGVAFLCFLVLFSVTTLSQCEAPPGSVKLTVDESMALAKMHSDDGNYDLAIEFWEKTKTNLPAHDPRKASIEEIIKELRAKQIEKYSSQGKGNVEGMVNKP